ncbi:MAG: hypothetical protein K6F76_07145 [Clostridiales bacterium]|nr:hypothetical protein [Clostridiales bacterium]
MTKKFTFALILLVAALSLVTLSGCNAEWYNSIVYSDSDSDTDGTNPEDYIEYNYEDITGVSFSSSASYVQGCSSFDLISNDDGKLYMSAHYYSESNDNSEIDFENAMVSKQVLNSFISSAQDLKLIEEIKDSIKRSKIENDGFFAYDATTYSICLYFKNGITLSYNGVGNNYNDLLKCLAGLADTVEH